MTDVSMTDVSMTDISMTDDSMTDDSTVLTELRNIKEIIVEKDYEIRVLWVSIFAFPIIVSLCSIALSVYISNECFV